MSPTVRNGRGERETYEVGLVGSPLGAIARRQAADHEREGFTPARPSPGLSLAPRHPSPVASARVLATVTGPTVTARTIEEEPVMAIERPVETQSHLEQDPPVVADSRLDALRAVAIAVDELVAATEAYQAAGARLEGAERAVEEAWARAPWRPKGWTNIPETIPDELDPIAIRRTLATPAGARAAIEQASGHAGHVDVDAIAADLESSEPFAVFPLPPVSAGGGPGPKLTQRDRILGAIVEQRGQVKAIASALGVDRAVVNAQLHQLGRQHRLTIAMLDVLPASFAKYSTAGD